MIPKIIHYCWLSNDPYPEKIQMCIDSWRRVLPDYEIIHWNFDRFPRGKSKWVDDAFDNKKYAFAADYIRLYALYNYGGIYLDSDVEVLKSFDDLLDLPYFLGQEQTPSGIEAATLGFEKGNVMLGMLLERYNTRDFITSYGPDMLPIPYVIRSAIASDKSYHVISRKEDFVDSPEVINIFSADYFSPKCNDTKSLKITEHTYSIHHFSGSWCPPGYLDKKTTPQKPFVKRLLFAVRNYFLLRKNTIIVTNSRLGLGMYKRFGYEYESPLLNCAMPEDYFKTLACHREYLKSDNIEFLKQKDSIYANYNNDFYPVIKIKGTNIQICYENTYSRERISFLWNKKNIETLRRKRLVYVYLYRSLTSKEQYMLCLKIKFGKKYIVYK